MKWIIKKETVSTEYLPLKRLNIMEGDNIVTRLTDKDENSKVNANLIASAPEMLELLKDVGRFILNDCHRWEEQKRGKYETRRRIDKRDGVVVRVQGSGKANEMSKKIYELLNKIEDK